MSYMEAIAELRHAMARRNLDSGKVYSITLKADAYDALVYEAKIAMNRTEEPEHKEILTVFGIKIEKAKE
jgi:hypothetical protein